MAKPLFEQVTIVGLGLIGGSLGMALRRRGLARRVVGVARRAATIAQARRRGAIDRGHLTLAPAAAQAELVVIATPPSTVVPLAQAVAEATTHGFLLTDVASTKGAIVHGWRRVLPPRIQAVGSHPMAGSEQRGLRAASATLFDQAVCVVTPIRSTPATAVRRVRALWAALGMQTMCLSPQRHDAAVAMVSHVPHLAAVSLMVAASPSERRVAAAGFSEMTRIALGDPALWQDIVLANRTEVLGALARFERALVHLRQAIAYADPQELLKVLAASRRKRQQLREMRT